MGCNLRCLFLTPAIAHKLQAENAWQTSDAELQASQIKAERDKADLLAKQLQGRGCMAAQQGVPAAAK